MSGEMSAEKDHPWRLVGPWYRWPQPGAPTSGRASRPVFQKYAAATFINEFLAEPQRSLKYLGEDFVQRVVPGKASKYSLANTHLEATAVRKIFLPTHGRFYLVVCELHCDVPNFPRASRDAVCEAGFVIRKRVVVAPPAARKAAASALSDLAAAEGQLAALETVAAGTRLRTVAGPQVKKLVEAQALALTHLRDAGAVEGVRVSLQGWVPAGPGLGAWREVEETPQVTDELIVPLSPLIPDPAQKSHSAAGRTIWFGLLPAGGSDLDEAGIPRFDDRSLYEVRCFVRRHKPGCPKKPGGRDCHGPLVWSEPTERYQLASHFDLDGTSLRPVTIQLPDLEALKAQTGSLPFGSGVGVRMISPPKSAMEFSADGTDATDLHVPGAAICSFAIPLITIVASFVLRLFLPIVILVFNLWFLLLLKFCIPPSIAVDAGLAAAVEGGLDIDVSFSATIDAQLDACLGVTARNKLKIDAGGDLNVLAKMAVDLNSDFMPSAPPDLVPDLVPYTPPTPPAKAKTLPSVAARLQYYDVVEAPV